MFTRIVLSLAIIVTFIVQWYNLTSEIDFVSIIVAIFLTCFQIIAAIYIYKNAVGYNNFDNPEGLSIKRKK